MDLIELVQKTPEVAPDISVTEAVTIMSAREVGAVAVTVEGKMSVFSPSAISCSVWCTNARIRTRRRCVR